MGTDCAPVVANLFLFAYEYEFMKGLLKDNITLAIKFSNKAVTAVHLVELFNYLIDNIYVLSLIHI